MGKKISLIIATCLLLVGIVMGAIVFWKADFKFSSFVNKVDEFTEKTAEYGNDSGISKIKLNSMTARVSIGVSADDKIHLKYDTDEYEDYVIQITETNTLCIEYASTKPWYAQIFKYQTSPKFAITIPSNSTKYILDLKVTTGNMSIENIANLTEIEVDATTADVEIKNVIVTNSIDVEVSTGAVLISESIIPTSIDATTSTGSITISNNTITSGTINLHTNTGSTKISSITAKDIKVKSSTGTVYLENVTASNKMEVEVKSGSIIATRIDSYNIDLKTRSGSIKGSIVGTVADYKTQVEVDSGDSNVMNNASGTKNLKLETGSGSINMKFVD